MAFNIEAFMERFEDRFSKEVDSHAIARRLDAKRVITPAVLHKILGTDTGDGSSILYSHMRDKTSLEALHKLCDVMIDATGLQRMQKLGQDMKKALSESDMKNVPEGHMRIIPESAITKEVTTATLHDSDSSMSDATSDVHYVVMTANKNEWKSAQHFLGVKCEVSDKVKKQTFKDDEVLKHKVQGINPDATIKGTGYSFFTVANKNAVLMKCSSMGSTAGEGSQYATFELLTMAQKRGWPLEAIFIVGCCAAISGTKETSETGSVFVANKIYYHGSGTLEDGTHKNKFDPYSASTVHCDNLEGLGLPTIQNIKIVSMLSGDLLVKDKEAAEERRKGLGEKRIGFEMEGFGVIKAVKLHELQHKPSIERKVVLLKGVSDDASPDKNKSASIMFFSKKMDDVDEDTRQQMCTIMSLTIALRAICNEYV